MKNKKANVVMSLVLVFMPILFGFTSNVVAAEQELGSEIIQGDLSYEESLELPIVSEDNLFEGITDETLNSFSSSNAIMANKLVPNSLEDYKKLGYTNFEYSKWSGYRNFLSTKSTRIAQYMVMQLGFLIPSNYVKIPLMLYDISQVLKTQNADIWPSVNTRNIIAKSPRGNEVLIGQQTTTKYYGNSSRTKSIKTIYKTYWLG